MAKDYFQSKEFKELLQSYEEQHDRGESIYLDADDFADLADYYLSIDQPSLAMDTLLRGLSLHPDDEVLMIVLSASHIYQRQYDEAEEVLQKLDSTNSDVKYQLAQLQYAKYGQVKKAEKIWREWMKLENGQEPTEQHRRESYIHVISSLIELRGNSRSDKEYDVEAVRRWIREYIDTFSPLGAYDEDVQLADICRDNDLADLMAEVLTQVLEEQPYLPKGWANLALAQYLLAQYEQALESSDFALAVNPNDLEALLTKAHTYHSMGEKKLAKPVFKEYLDKGGDAVQIIPYADSLFVTGERDVAISELEWLSNFFENRRLETEKKYQETKAMYGTDQQKMQDADDMYDDFLDLYKRILTDISDLYHHNECYEESLAVNRRLTEVDPQDSEAYFMLGINSLALGRYEEASRNFAFALQWADDQVMMGVDIALTFVLNNFDKFALEVLNAVSQIAANSDSPFAKNIPAAKSLTYLKLGHKDQFLRYFKQACQDTPDLVKKVYEGYFPENYPVNQWSDYAVKNIDKLMRKFRGENFHFQDFT
ncbi:MAG: tetratricopeptide repeat protein [Bacteroidaceae bacterium]|nr:tetratricopeptide repeat protein [Bacteroidaceae bacterium]